MKLVYESYSWVDKEHIKNLLHFEMTGLIARAGAIPCKKYQNTYSYPYADLFSMYHRDLVIQKIIIKVQMYDIK